MQRQKLEKKEISKKNDFRFSVGLPIELQEIYCFLKKERKREGRKEIEKGGERGRRKKER